MSKSLKRWFFLLMLIAGVVAADQVSKQMVIDNLLRGEAYQPVPALAAYFQFLHSINTGSAFGFFAGAGDILLVLAICIVIGLLIYFPRIPEDGGLSRLAVGLILGGALGNIVDRIRHEHVIDFIHYQIPGVISNVSNVADHAIVLGVILIFIDGWRAERRTEPKDAEQRPDSEALHQDEKIPYN